MVIRPHDPKKNQAARVGVAHRHGELQGSRPACVRNIIALGAVEYIELVQQYHPTDKGLVYLQVILLHISYYS